MCFVWCSCRDLFCALTWKRAYIYDKSFEMCICFWQNFECGWHVKIQLLSCWGRGRGYWNAWWDIQSLEEFKLGFLCYQWWYFCLLTAVLNGCDNFLLWWYANIRGCIWLRRCWPWTVTRPRASSRPPTIPATYIQCAITTTGGEYSLFFGLIYIVVKTGGGKSNNKNGHSYVKETGIFMFPLVCCACACFLCSGLSHWFKTILCSGLSPWFETVVSVISIVLKLDVW